VAFFLTNKAKTDLKNIARYTHQEWGISQRNFDLTQIDQAFYLLAQLPDHGRKCDDIREGYRKYKVGKHVVFYRLVEEDIEVVRILHERMDFEQHLL
jgi:toxin ParE1/3/4